VSQAARLAGMHPQTLRQYDRLGLVTPRRTAGRGRRYSQRDVSRLLEVQRLAQVEGINLAGIRRILARRGQVARRGGRLAALAVQPGGRGFAAGSSGDVVVVRRGQRVRRTDLEAEEGALVLWRPLHRRD